MTDKKEKVNVAKSIRNLGIEFSRLHPAETGESRVAILFGNHLGLLRERGRKREGHILTVWLHASSKLG
jgi:hypothetical protein